jgi:hypothetical protein
MKRVVVCLAVAACAVAVGQAHAAGCVAGMKKVGGVSARTFCGPAKATVKIGGSTVAYKGGQCETSSAGWSLNIGTVVLGQSKTKPEYLGVSVSKAKPGSQPAVAVAVDHANKGYAVIGGTVTLKPGLHAGTFTGTAFGLSSKVSGSFSC